MGWWIFRGIAATGYIIMQWYDSDPRTCYFDPDNSNQAVYCE